jgi:V8-like Glu-specific endopeptidase
MNGRPWLRRIVLGVVAMAPAVALIAAPAQATTSPAVAVHSPVVTAHTATKQYWTKQRMLSATPVAQPTTDQRAVAAPTATGPSGQVAGTRASGIQPHDNGLFDMTGRIFFTEDDGTDHSCSGSIVNSAGKDLVFTAGHCVHGQGSSHAWWTNWAFVPGYQDGNAPHGTWYANQLWSMQGWTTDGNRYYDVGIAIMATDSNGNHIANALGGQGLEWNEGYSRSIYDFGYPADPPYDGSTMYYCAGTTYSTTEDVGVLPTLNCGMNGGASGGPWLDGYSDTTYWAYLYTVNSWMFWTGSTDANVYKWEAPYFGDDVQSLYTTVQNL